MYHDRMRNEKGQFVKGIYVGFGFKKGVIPWNYGKKGYMGENKTSFKKGQIPWNKGTKGICKASSGSIKKGEHRSKITEFTSSRTLNELNSQWKGDGVGYYALHCWLKRKLGKAKLCKNRKCRFLPFVCSKKSKTFHWANRSREYKRDSSDWVQLCISCHLKADRRKILL